MSGSLPSARPRALGKDVVCRGHSAKIWHTACPGVAKCRPSANQDTWQRGSFAECWSGGTQQSPSTCPARAPAVRRPSGGLTASTFCRVPPAGTRQKVKYCRVSPAGTRQSRNVAECACVALGKASFAECWCPGTRQTWLKNFFWAFKFFWSPLKFDNVIPSNIK